MENYESNKDINEEGKIITDGNKIKELNSKIQSLYIEETKDSECIISIIQISKIESQNENIPKSICQIKIETRSETLLELGFLLKFMIEQECFYCFIYNGNENINKIINSNNKIIENFIYLFTELDINWKKEEFCSKSIDIVYIEIINALIKNRKIDDYGLISDLIKQLDLENIDFTKIMINKLYEIFNSNKDYINDYLILNLEDFSNEKKVNFYYILLKYILKNSIYIYQIPFFIKTSVNIKQILNSNNPIYIN